jgi:hypothetical protein
MFEKLSIFFVGILLILVGIRIYSFRVFDTMKFGLVNMGQYHSVIGVIFVVVGLFFLYNITRIIIRDKRKGPPPR